MKQKKQQRREGKANKDGMERRGEGSSNTGNRSKCGARTKSTEGDLGNTDRTTQMPLASPQSILL